MFNKARYYLKYLFEIKFPIKRKLRNIDNAVFFCANSTIGDNVILLSFIEPYLKAHKVKKVYYYGKRKYIDLLKSLYPNYSDSVIYMPIKDKSFDYWMSKEGIMNRIIDLCNRYPDNAYHTLFFAKEIIPSGETVISYQMKKMKLDQSSKLYLPKLEGVRKENQIFLNVDSQTIKSDHIKEVANKVVKYCNKHNIKVIFNSKERLLDGEYELMFPSFKEFIALVEASKLLVSIRTGLVDLSMGTSTNTLVFYDEEIVDSFSLKMWPKQNNKIIKEITINEYRDELLEKMIKESK